MAISLTDSRALECPFRVGRDGTSRRSRSNSSFGYRGAHLPELSSKRLACDCPPREFCHGDVLVGIAVERRKFGPHRVVAAPADFCRGRSQAARGRCPASVSSPHRQVSRQSFPRGTIGSGPSSRIWSTIPRCVDFLSVLARFAAG